MLGLRAGNGEFNTDSSCSVMDSFELDLLNEHIYRNMRTKTGFCARLRRKQPEMLKVSPDKSKKEGSQIVHAEIFHEQPLSLLPTSLSNRAPVSYPDFTLFHPWPWEI